MEFQMGKPVDSTQGEDNRMLMPRWSGVQGLNNMGSCLVFKWWLDGGFSNTCSILAMGIFLSFVSVMLLEFLSMFCTQWIPCYYKIDNEHMSIRMLPYESHSNPGGCSNAGDGRTSSCVGASPLGHRSIMNRPWSWCWGSEDFLLLVRH